jgi:hypothetical protein
VFGKQGWVTTALAVFEDRRVRRFWHLGLVALVLHGLADPLLTYFAVVYYGVATELNPFIAAPLQQGAGTFVAVHIPLYILFFALMGGYTWLFSRASPAEVERLYRFSLIGWAVIILWGAVLVGYNLLIFLRGVA